jgi:hypothetical protein
MEQTVRDIGINAGLADGYFVLPYYWNYLADDIRTEK